MRRAPERVALVAGTRRTLALLLELHEIVHQLARGWSRLARATGRSAQRERAARRVRTLYVRVARPLADAARRAGDPGLAAAIELVVTNR